jgi:hypothetical protein
LSEAPLAGQAGGKVVCEKFLPRSARFLPAEGGARMKKTNN